MIVPIDIYCIKEKLLESKSTLEPTLKGSYSLESKSTSVLFIILLSTLKGSYSYKSLRIRQVYGIDHKDKSGQ